MDKYKELTSRLETIKAILSRKGDAMDYRILFVEFNEGCLRGYADDFTGKQKEAMLTMLYQIQEMIEQQEGDSTELIEDSIACFENAIGEGEEPAGYTL